MTYRRHNLALLHRRLNDSSHLGGGEVHARAMPTAEEDNVEGVHVLILELRRASHGRPAFFLHPPVVVGLEAVGQGARVHGDVAAGDGADDNCTTVVDKVVVRAGAFFAPHARGLVLQLVGRRRHNEHSLGRAGRLLRRSNSQEVCVLRVLILFLLQYCANGSEQEVEVLLRQRHHLATVLSSRAHCGLSRLRREQRNLPEIVAHFVVDLHLHLALGAGDVRGSSPLLEDEEPVPRVALLDYLVARLVLLRLQGFRKLRQLEVVQRLQEFYLMEPALVLGVLRLARLRQKHLEVQRV
mmetsp:Transcript_3152/g.8470  ORF Transcript_3152/g.8470 Transcript_3152/m.8470 type:complete len:297 (-) Transcript_3152:775-1665(-)